jgi:hypothetical protein
LPRLGAFDTAIAKLLPMSPLNALIIHRFVVMDLRAVALLPSPLRRKDWGFFLLHIVVG